MAQTLQITVSDTDAVRVQAVAAQLGFPSAKAMIISLVVNAVSSAEHAISQAQYSQGYAPIQGS